MRVGWLCERVVGGYKGVVVECFERFDDGGVEVSAALAEDLGDAFVDWPWLLVGSAMDECVEYVGHSD